MLKPISFPAWLAIWITLASLAHFAVGENLPAQKTTASQPTLLDKFHAGSMPNVEEIIFAARQPGKDQHWYANFGYYANDPQRKAYGDGGKLYRLNLRTKKLTTLLSDEKGGVRDPQARIVATNIKEKAVFISI